MRCICLASIVVRFLACCDCSRGTCEEECSLVSLLQPFPSGSHAKAEHGLNQGLALQAAIDADARAIAKAARSSAPAASRDRDAGGVLEKDHNSSKDVRDGMSQQRKMLQASINAAVIWAAFNTSAAWNLPNHSSERSVSPSAEGICNEGTDLQTVWSCDSHGHSNLRSDHPDFEPQHVLNNATEEICAQDDLRTQLETKLDCRSTESYLRFADPESGWLEEAYVTYLGGTAKPDYVQATHNLIRSVHAFSKRPIVLVVIGYDYVLPAAWQQFPNLIVYRMDNLLPGLGFNFNKDRAILGARVRTGIQLDGDQIVASPKMDGMFAATRLYCTAQYPFPIPPLHWMSREGGPGASYYDEHYAFKDYDGRRSMRWAHAHPTYTYHAVPFFHDVLLVKYTAQLRSGASAKVWDLRADQSTDLLALLSMGADGRVDRECTSAKWMYSDEPMLNVHLWKANATRHWCKMDLEPDLYMTPHLAENIYWDHKWYPDGIPLMFYSVHNTKHFPETLVLLALLEACGPSAATTSPSCETLPAAAREVCDLATPEGMQEAMERDAEFFAAAACCCLSPHLTKPASWQQHDYSDSAMFPEHVRGAAQGEQMCLVA